MFNLLDSRCLLWRFPIDSGIVGWPPRFLRTRGGGNVLARISRAPTLAARDDCGGNSGRGKPSHALPFTDADDECMESMIRPTLPPQLIPRRTGTSGLSRIPAASNWILICFVHRLFVLAKSPGVTHDPAVLSPPRHCRRRRRSGLRGGGDEGPLHQLAVRTPRWQDTTL